MKINYRKDLDDLSLSFEAAKLNWEGEHNSEFARQEAPFEVILAIVTERLASEQRSKTKETGMQMAQQAQAMKQKAAEHGSLTSLLSQARRSKLRAAPGKETDLDQAFVSRKSRGNQRVAHNEHITRITGLYNERGQVHVSCATTVEPFDIFNLTAGARVTALDRHFEVMQAAFKQQLKTEQFDDFGLPV